MCKLSPESLCEVFKNLNLEELIKCRLANKYWYSIINDLVKVKRLVVGRNYSSKWYFTNELIKEEIECCHFSLFLTQYKRSFLANLNYLFINPAYSNFDINIVNLFTQLVHFETIVGYKLNAINNLNLPNLQVFSFYTELGSGNLTINCPKLKVLYYKNCHRKENLDIKHPNSITHLETCVYDEKLKMLKNIEYLITDNYKAIDESTLSNILNLKEFHFNRNIDSLILDLNYNPNKFNYLKDRFRLFMNQKRSLRMNSLKVFFLGIQFFENEDEINFDGLLQHFSSVDRSGQNLEKFFMNNYNRLKDNLTFIHEVNYGNLMAAVNEIPNDFFKKFNSLNTVRSHGRIVNEEHFLSFLKSIKKLSYVDLRQDVSLKVGKSLIGLYSTLNILDFEFSSYKFKFKNFSFEIEKKEGNDKYGLWKSYDLVKEDASSNEMINYFEKLN